MHEIINKNNKNNFHLINCSQVANNRISGPYVFDHENLARRALKNTALGLSLPLHPDFLSWNLYNK